MAHDFLHFFLTCTHLKRTCGGYCLLVILSKRGRKGKERIWDFCACFVLIILTEDWFFAIFCNQKIDFFFVIYIVCLDDYYYYYWLILLFFLFGFPLQSGSPELQSPCNISVLVLFSFFFLALVHIRFRMGFDN
jgi:hypothetical protein